MRLFGEDIIRDHLVIVNIYQFILSSLNFRLRLLLVVCTLLFLFNNVAAITVDTLDDLIDSKGDCSLREAIESATITKKDEDGCTYDGNIINFDRRLGGQTISFTSTVPSSSFNRLVISADLTIDGPNITLDGGNQRVLKVDSGNVELIGLTIINGGSAAHGYGGNIHNSGKLTITNCMLKNGEAEYKGGGIYNNSGASLTLYGSTVYNNRVLNTSGNNPGGGGIYNDGGTVEIINSTITNNKVTANGPDTNADHGGGIRNNSGTLTIENSTITYNRVNTNAKQGGGIYVADGTVTIKNSIIAGNFGAADYKDCQGSITSNGYNLIGATTGCPTNGDGDIPFSGSITDIFDNLPNLVNTVHPLKPYLNNPAFDKVPNGTNDCGAPPFDYDQLGTPRPYSQGGNCDIGACNCDIGAYEMAPIIYHQIEVNPTAQEVEDLAGTRAFVINRYGGAISCDTTIDYTVTGTATLDLDTGPVITPADADYEITHLLNGLPSNISSWDNGSFSLSNQDVGILLTNIFSDTIPETNESILVTLSNPQLDSSSSTNCQNILAFFGIPRFLLSDGTPFTEISATFTITDDDGNSDPFSLSITKSGSGSGTITGDGINCGTTCTNSYSSGTNINLNVVADSDSIFAGWSGGTNCSSSFTINADMNCTATFDLRSPDTVVLTILQTGTGEGNVSINGLACGNPCRQNYTIGNAITLTATPNVNSIFAGWLETNCSSSFTINTDMTCTAIFNSNSTPPSAATLTITKSGTGDGTISGSGINCGNICNYTYSPGTAVTLMAMPDSNSTFVGWSGINCGSSFTITTPMNCTARFERQVSSTPPTPPLPPTMTVTLSQPGNDQGEFVFSPNPQETTCNVETTRCTYTFPTATWVKVTAKVANNSIFKGWRGSSQCDQNKGNQLEFFMNGNYNCTAEFERLPTVLKLVTIGNGQILTSPIGNAIPCEMEQCFQFDFNRKVTLTPQAGEGLYFDNWSGNSDCQTGQVQMDDDKICVATFSPSVKLTLDYDPRQGQVTFTPAGKNCGEYCQRYRNGTPVTLIAQAQPGYQLASWGSDCNQPTLTTTLEISLIKDWRCKVTFIPITTSPDNPSPATFSTLTVNSSDNGTVTSVPPGISCGTDCTESYPTGTVVTLNATPAPNFQVASWSESCLAGQVALETNKTCQVSFESTQLEEIPALSIIQFAMPEYQINEHSDQGKALVFVTRSGSKAGTVEVDFTTIDGTALADSDYTPINGKLTWSSGDTAPKTITVPILRDDLNETAEIFIVQLSNLTGKAQFGPYSRTVVTMVDNSSADSLELAPTESTDSNNVLPSPTVLPTTSAGRIQFVAPIYEVMEQDALAPLEGLIKIAVVRVDGNQGKVAVNYKTQDGIAIAGEHYQPSEGKIVWDDGETGEKLITVDIWDNKLREETKSFRLILSSPTNGAVLGDYPDITVVIKDDDMSMVGFSPENTHLAFEDNQQAQITVSRSNSSVGEVNLHYTTIDGTAKAGEDYVATSGTLKWGNGEHQQQTINVPLLSSHNKVGNQTFQLSLFDPTGEVVLATPSTISITITTSKPNLCEITNNVVDCLIIREPDSPPLENIRITSRGTLINSRLAGQIHNAGWLQNTVLMPNTTVMGGYISSSLSGQSEQPVTAVLRNVEVVAGASLKHVVIGKGSHVANQTNLNSGVCFEANDLIPNQTLNQILGHAEQTVLGQKAVKLNQDVLCQSARGGLLGAINGLPQLKNFGWQVTQDPTTGILNLTRGELHFAALPLQVNQVLTEEMVDELPLGITFTANGQVIFHTHTGRKILAYPIIQAPLVFQTQLRQLGLNSANLLPNGNIEVPLRDGSYFVARADLIAKQISPAVPIGLNYLTQPISLVFADPQANHWQQMLYPTAAYPEALDKLADLPTTTQLTPTGRVKIRHGGYLYEGTLDYLVTPNQQPRTNNSLRLLKTNDLNDDGCNDNWIHYHTGEKQALLSNCFK
jgi:CSLREA domain-containing protein